MLKLLFLSKGFPHSSVGKESTCSARDPGFIPELGRYPGKGNDNPFQYLCLEKSHRQRNLVGCSRWGHEESVMAEQLTHVIP